MRRNRLLRGGATKAPIKEAFSFQKVGRPHLLDNIRKAWLENSACDRLERSAKAQLGALPPLFFPSFKLPKSLGFRRTEANSAFGSTQL